MTWIQVRRLKGKKRAHRCDQFLQITGGEVPATDPSGEDRVPGQEDPMLSIVEADPSRGVAWSMDYLKIVISGGEGFPPYKVLHARSLHPAHEHQGLGALGGPLADDPGIILVSEQRRAQVPGEGGRSSHMVIVPVGKDYPLDLPVADDLPYLVHCSGVMLPSARVHY